MFEVTVQQSTIFTFAKSCVHPTVSLLKTDVVSFCQLVLISHNKWGIFPSEIVGLQANIQGVPGGMDKTSGECSLC